MAARAFCEECGREFVGGNSLARFCSGACRQRSWSRRNPGYMVEAQRRYLERDPTRKARKRERLAEYHRQPENIARANALRRARYAANPEPARARSSAQFQRFQRLLSAVKTTCGCIDCGTREGVLHFDHRPGTVKDGNPSDIRGLRRVIAEIMKCDVRCASCHARRHEHVKRLARAGATVDG